jgi:ribosomal subunit interface protein
VKLLLQGRHLAITDALRGYTHRKVKRLLRFSSLVAKVDVTFDGSRHSTYTAKIIAGLPRNKTIVCSERDRTLTAALDRAVDSVERRLSTIKERLHRKGSREKVTRRLMGER